VPANPVPAKPVPADPVPSQPAAAAGPVPSQVAAAAGPVPSQPAAAAGTRRLRPAWSLSPHAMRLITLAVAGLIIAVLTRRPEFAGVAAPAVLLLAVRRPARPATITVTTHLSRSSVIENQRAELSVTLAGQGDCVADVMLHPRYAVVPEAPEGPGPAASGEPGGGSRLPFRVVRSGRRSLGVLEIRLWDRWRLAEARVTTDLPLVDCYPHAAPLQRRIVLSRLPSRLGEHPSRSAGEGIEFTGVREFVPGDRQRRINWPATTRRGRLQLNTFAAERTQNVVIIADASSDVGEPGATPVDLALRGSAAVAQAYLAVRDRVGLIVFQWGVRWVTPGLGARQYHRLMDLMMADAGRTGSLSRGPALMTRLPRAALPPGSLVLVFSPLLDRRMVETLRDLRERGFSVVIIDVLNAEPSGRNDSLSGLARRIWRMEQEAIRFSLRELGIPLVHWDGEQSLDGQLAPYTRRVMVSRR
jgi:uncharacterized protein (DUF58 family)